MKHFALMGAGGYIAPRHLQAIHETGNELVAALDVTDSVGILDRYFPQTRFFKEPERFERFLHQCRVGLEREHVDFVSICTPNYLHDAHVRMALTAETDAICEKPLVISPWNLDVLREVEEESGRQVYTILQLRLHPALFALKERLDSSPQSDRTDVCLTYVTHRGPWYDISWKGSQEKSGGIAMNIGVHFFDLCLWLFGSVDKVSVHIAEARRMAGVLELERATVRWFLSIERGDLPEGQREEGAGAYRSLTIGDQEVDFTHGFTDLHDEVYRNILAGKGLGIEDARPSIELVHAIRHSDAVEPGDVAHPFLKS